MPHENVTLVWGYGRKKDELEDFGDLLRRVRRFLRSLPQDHQCRLRGIQNIHVTILGCEAKESGGEFYSRPLLQHLFGPNDFASLTTQDLDGNQIDFDQLARIAHITFDKGITVKFGGYHESSWPPLLYPGWSMYKMSFYFGFLAPDLVLTGWPTPNWGWQLMGFRALAETANVMHKYHSKG